MVARHQTLHPQEPVFHLRVERGGQFERAALLGGGVGGQQGKVRNGEGAGARGEAWKVGFFGILSFFLVIVQNQISDNLYIFLGMFF